MKILNGLKSRFEEHHQVRYSRSAMRIAAELSHRYINERFLPDKAIDVIDEAGASQKLVPPSRRRKTIGAPEIERVVSKMARIPSKTVSTSDKDVLRTLDRDIKLVVFGQDQAIETLASAIKMARSGLREGEKPIGSFLFAGPTGVGKTEVTRQLARVMGIELVRFDMSEYMERHTVSRLIGAPPGYVGFDQGGLLTEAINKHPHAVLLLDEIEKAHPDVFNLLLQVMDHGTLTDNNGRKADFRNVILVMTTNAGADRMSRPSIGFTVQDHSGDGLEAIQADVQPRVPQPAGLRRAVRSAGRGHHRPRGRQVHHRAGRAARGQARDPGGGTRRRAPGSPSTASMRSWAHARWRASSRSTSSVPSPTSCCSGGSRAAGTSRSRRATALSPSTTSGRRNASGSRADARSRLPTEPHPRLPAAARSPATVPGGWHEPPRSRPARRTRARPATRPCTTSTSGDSTALGVRIPDGGSKRRSTPGSAFRLHEMRSPVARLQFAAGRWLARRVLARRIGCTEAEIELAVDTHGRPSLASGGIDFNLSHAGSCVVIALSEVRVGIDVESVERTRDWRAIAQRFFSPAETAAIEACTAQQRRMTFFRIWVRKEAFVKALGTGVATGFDRFDVSAGTEAALLAARIEGVEAAEWSIVDFEPGAGHLGAVAVRATRPRIRVREIRP